MEQDSIDLNQQPDPIDEKLRDTAAMEKIFKQAVFEAVDKAQRLGFLPIPLPLQSDTEKRTPSQAPRTDTFQKLDQS